MVHARDGAVWPGAEGGRRMKILVVLTDLWGASGGIPTFNRTLLAGLEELLDSQSEVRVLVLNDPYGSSKKKTSATIHVQEFAGHRLSFVRAVVGEAAGADHVFLGHIHFSPLVWFLGSSRITAVLHGIEAWEPLPWFRRWGLRKIDLFLPVSQYTRDRFCGSNRVSMDRCRVFPDTLLDRLTTASELLSRSVLGLPAEGRMMLTVSRTERPRLPSTRGGKAEGFGSWSGRGGTGA